MACRAHAVNRPAPLNLPPAAADGPVDEATVEFAIGLIDRVATTTEAALAKTRGRPRSVPVTAVLAALVILAISDQPLLLTNVTTLLYRRIGSASRHQLGLTEADISTGRRFNARYRCIRYTFGLLCASMDPSPLPKNRRLTNSELAAATRAMTTDDITAARDKLEAFANALLEATMALLTDEEYAAWDGSLGLDATPVPLFSQGPSQRSGLCAADPDGGWYVRDGDHRDTDDARTGKRKGRIYWALEATIATMTRDPDTVPTYPLLAAGLIQDRPGIDPGGTGARVLASIRARGHRPGWLGYDRAYTSATPDTFHLPVAALGYHPVMDYKIDQLGARANTSGAVLVDGTWCCPATPQPLINATVDHRNHDITEQLHAERITARTAYHLKPKDPPDADGYYRMSCPALGSRLACGHRPDSQTDSGPITVLNPPDPAPAVCTQTAITIAPNIGARYRQDLPHGTETWRRRYATMRNTIEGLNGYIKDPAHETLAAPARRRIRGITAQTIFSAFLIAAANIRKIRAHRTAVTNNHTSQIAQRARARRRQTSLRDYQPPAVTTSNVSDPGG
jgi:hypothetical protein